MNLVDYNQVNDIVHKELKYDSSISLATNSVNDPLHVVTISLRADKNSRKTFNSGRTCMWYSGPTIGMIKRKHINPYKSKLGSNKFKYSIVSGPYNTAHELKVPFRMTEVSSS